MHRWRYPSLSLHGIEGAFAEAGAKTVIPRKVIGKFSIRLVPDMDPKVVEKQVMLKEIEIAIEMNTNMCSQTIYSTILKKLKSLAKFLYFRFMHILVNFHVQVMDHLQKTFDEMGSPNKMKVSMGHGAKAWVSDFNHPHYMAGRKAMKTGIVPQYFKFSLKWMKWKNCYIS